VSTGEKFCPYFQQAAELIGRRWTGAVLRALLAGPLRFSQIERAVRKISARALAQRLRELEATGLVVRRVDTGIPVRVSYRLTEKGKALEDVVARIERWAHDWLAPRGISPHAPTAEGGDRRLRTPRQDGHYHRPGRVDAGRRTRVGATGRLGRR
jgi:DNA-binding HxlR family transcriptional regulator